MPIQIHRCRYRYIDTTASNRYVLIWDASAAAAAAAAHMVNGPPALLGSLWAWPTINCN